VTSLPRRPLSPGRRLLPLFLHLLLFVLAMGLFSWALVAADPGELGESGLLDVLPPQYYVALLLLVLGFVLAVTGPRPVVPLLVLYTLGLIAVLHGTVPILFEEPRYPWTYKHIAATELIGATGSVERSLDIYNNWPGFFAIHAWFSDALGIAPLEYARWAQPAFATAGFAAVVFAVRPLNLVRRRRRTPNKPFRKRQLRHSAQAYRRVVSAANQPRLSRSGRLLTPQIA